MAFESLDVRLLALRLTCRPHRIKDLSPLPSQVAQDCFMRVVLIASKPIVGPCPLRTGQAGEAPILKCAAQGFDTGGPHPNFLPLPAGLSGGITTSQIREFLSRGKAPLSGGQEGFGIGEALEKGHGNGAIYFTEEAQRLRIKLLQISRDLIGKTRFCIDELSQIQTKLVQQAVLFG